MADQVRSRSRRWLWSIVAGLVALRLVVLATDTGALFSWSPGDPPMAGSGPAVTAAALVQRLVENRWVSAFELLADDADRDVLARQYVENLDVFHGARTFTVRHVDEGSVSIDVATDVGPTARLVVDCVKRGADWKVTGWRWLNPSALLSDNQGGSSGTSNLHTAEHLPEECLKELQARLQSDEFMQPVIDHHGMGYRLPPSAIRERQWLQSNYALTKESTIGGQVKPVVATWLAQAALLRYWQHELCFAVVTNRDVETAQREMEVSNLCQFALGAETIERIEKWMATSSVPPALEKKLKNLCAVLKAHPVNLDAEIALALLEERDDDAGQLLDGQRRKAPREHVARVLEPLYTLADVPLPDQNLPAGSKPAGRSLDGMQKARMQAYSRTTLPLSEVQP